MSIPFGLWIALAAKRMAKTLSSDNCGSQVRHGPDYLRGPQALCNGKNEVSISHDNSSSLRR